MEQWWTIKVYDAETRTTTNIDKFGELEDIKKELEEDGLWQFVSASPDND